MRLILFLLFIITISPVASQNRDYAKNIIDTLSSPSFFGRGYVNRGDSITSEFLKSEFEKIGLEATKGSYFQTYTHPVNTFPGKLNLSFDGLLLKKGSQYHIDPFSCSGEGDYNISTISKEDFTSDQWLEKVKKSKRKVLSIDLTTLDEKDKSNEKYLEFVQYLKFEENIPAKALLIYKKNKQPWYVSNREGYRSVFTIFKDSIKQMPKTVSFQVENKFIENYRSKNVIGKIPGTSDSTIVITAHYDHLGMMGDDCYFPGANDNASGVALMLDLANYFKENPIKHTVYFIAFSGEEAGLLGSQHFVQNPLFPLKKIKFLLNIDLAGTGIDGATVVNGAVFEDEFQLLTSINEENNFLKTVNARGEACNSDHCFFYKKGVKSFFIYTLGGTKYYHDIFDSSDTLPLNEYDNYFKLIRNFLERR